MEIIVNVEKYDENWAPQFIFTEELPQHIWSSLDCNIRLLNEDYHQVKIHTQTGVGAHQEETHYQAIDYAKKGDGQF